jgi:thiol-disulfide isomerase/thioredoxin
MAVAKLTDGTVEPFIKKHPYVLVDCSTEWCGPCRAFAPHFKALAKEFPHVKFAAMDMDRCPETERRWRINCYPTFFLVVRGRTRRRIEGAPSKGEMREEIKDAFRELFG